MIRKWHRFLPAILVFFTLTACIDTETQPEPTLAAVSSSTPSPEPTSTPKPTRTPFPTDTPIPTASPTPEPTETPLPTLTPLPTVSPTPELPVIIAPVEGLDLSSSLELNDHPEIRQQLVELNSLNNGGFVDLFAMADVPEVRERLEDLFEPENIDDSPVVLVHAFVRNVHTGILTDVHDGVNTRAVLEYEIPVRGGSAVEFSTIWDEFLDEKAVIMIGDKGVALWNEALPDQFTDLAITNILSDRVIKPGEVAGLLIIPSDKIGDLKYRGQNHVAGLSSAYDSEVGVFRDSQSFSEIKEPNGLVVVSGITQDFLDIGEWMGE